jgi:leader peptidase (prepilin peptidase)/N-methyltransferase
VIVALAALAGLLLGSFANVVIWRVPRGESIVSPPSSCPQCGSRIRWWQNVPIVSFLALRGRCASCRAPISWRYPAVELAMAMLFALTAWWRGLERDLPAFLALAFVALILTVIDIEHRRIPNAIVLPAIPVFVALLTLAGEWGSLSRAVVAGAALFAFYLAIALVTPRGMGMGDVKLAALVGVALGWIGWDALVVGAFAAFVLGAFGGLIMIASRGGSRKTAIPFGPWMLLGMEAGLIAGPAVAGWYLGMLGL